MSISTAPPTNVDPVVLEALTQHLSAESLDERRPFWKSAAAIRLAIIALILGSWELSAANGWVDPLFTSRPTDVAQAFWDHLPTSQLWKDAGYTLTEIAIGYAIGVTLGVLVGVALGSSMLLREACQPVLNALNSVPRIALVPLLVAWFGFGMAPRIVMAVGVVVFVMATAVVAAMSQPDRDSTLLARSLGASKRDTLVKFQLPRAVPVIVSGLELSLIYAFLGVIAAEIVSGSNGLGSRMTEYANLFQADDFFAVLVVLTALCTLLTAGIRRVERRLLRWHEFEAR